MRLLPQRPPSPRRWKLIRPMPPSKARWNPSGADRPAIPLRTPDSPLPFLRPLSPTSKAPVASDPPVLWLGPALHPGGYSYWTKQSVLWLRRAGVRVGLRKITGETVDSYLRSLDASDLRDLQAALAEQVRDGVLIVHHQPSFAGGPDIYRRMRWSHPQQLAYVGLTTFETESLPKHWLEPCRGMDEIWLFSTFNVRRVRARRRGRAQALAGGIRPGPGAVRAEPHAAAARPRATELHVPERVPVAGAQGLADPGRGVRADVQPARRRLPGDQDGPGRRDERRRPDHALPQREEHFARTGRADPRDDRSARRPRHDFALPRRRRVRAAHPRRRLGHPVHGGDGHGPADHRHALERPSRFHE